MKSRSLPLREVFLLGAPILAIAVVGAVLSNRQSEQRAEQQRLESGPLRLVVWYVHAMPILDEDKKKGYDFVMRIDARVEGVLPDDWSSSPRKVWIMSPKSAQILVGNFKQPSRVGKVLPPYTPTKTPHVNILAIGEIPNTEREATLWVTCDAPSSNAVLNIELEAVASDAKTGKPLGPRVVAPIEKFQLRPFDLYNEAPNNWKNLS